MKFHFLTSKFYDDYANCEQILFKDKRPYCFSICEINDVLIAVPLRSHLNKSNQYIIKTPNSDGGLDLTKSIVITSANRGKYIDALSSPTIRKEDYNFLLGKEYALEQRVKIFLKIYKKRYKNKIDNNSLLKYCSLQYFHKELGLE